VLIAVFYTGWQLPIGAIFRLFLSEIIHLHGLFSAKPVVTIITHEYARLRDELLRFSTSYVTIPCRRLLVFPHSFRQPQSTLSD